jgi:hypothetical protein
MPAGARPIADPTRRPRGWIVERIVNRRDLKAAVRSLGQRASLSPRHPALEAADMPGLITQRNEHHGLRGRPE